MNKDLSIFKTKQNAFLLSAFAFVCTLAVSVTYILTAPVIAKQKQQDVFNKLTQVLEQGQFDNNPMLNCTTLSDVKLFGTEQINKVYRATKNGEPYAVIFQTQTKQGYNGLIELMMAINADGQVTGVRTVGHQETPGLGDKIELAKSDWMLKFNQKKVASEADSSWYVKKDGGQFDQFTGATITPRAVVNQLRTSGFQASQTFEQLFSATNVCQTEQQTSGVENEQ